MMKKIWLTYAWVDNQDLDVDFVRQEIERCGALVKLDKWHIPAGKSLWKGIEKGICDPDESDAWAIYVTEVALRRPAVQEELDWALNRALSTRSEQYPLIGIFPAPLPDSTVPVALRVRRYVTLNEPNWADTVVEAAKGKAPSSSATIIPRTSFRWHESTDGVTLELRPRTGAWTNLHILVPTPERSKLSWVSFGAPGVPYKSPMMFSVNATARINEMEWIGLRFPMTQPNPAKSAYVTFSSKPVTMLAGVPSSDEFQALYVLHPDQTEQAF